MVPFNENDDTSKQEGSVEQGGRLSASLLLCYKDFKQIQVKDLDPYLSKKLADTENQYFADYTFNGHQIQVIALAEKLPERLLEFILPICHFSDESKEEFRTAGSHVILFYKEGHPEMAEQLKALYAFSAIIESSMIGLINENAWTAHPASMLREVLKEEDEKGLGFNTWFTWTGGFVKYFLPNGTDVWYATKGNHQFGFNEFALKGSAEQGEDIIEMFWVIFNYCFNNSIDLKPGESMTIGEGKVMKIEDVTEYHEYLIGEKGTVVLSI